jgi:hypothetical protein
LKYITKYFEGYEITNTRANSYPSFSSLLQKFIAKCVFEITRGDLGVKCGFSFVEIMKGVVNTLSK